MVYQQALLIAGEKAPETATSFGVVLAQAGFAAGASIGGLTINLVGIAAIPVVAVIFVLGSAAIAISLRQVAHATTST